MVEGVSYQNVERSENKKFSLDFLREEGKALWRKGCNIVLTKDKRPLHEWKQFLERRQTEKDLERLPWNKAEGIAIIMGQRVNNGHYICVLDLDVKNLPSEVVEKGRRIIESLPVTYTEKTPSGGFHYFYLSKEKPKTITAYREKCGIELLGEGHLCSVYPTPGYEPIRVIELTKVQDINQLFLNALSLAGITTRENNGEKEESWFDRGDLEITPYRDRDPPCIEKIKQGTKEGQRNEYAIRYCSYLLNFRKLEEDRAWKNVKEWNKRNEPPLDRNELKRTFDSAKKHGYKYGCNDPILSSLCDRNNCPLHGKLSKNEEEMRFDPEVEEEIEEEVKRILASENQLEVIKEHLDRIIVGEENIKIPIFVLLIGAKHKDPEYKQIIAIKGEEGSGKSHIANSLTEGYKTKKVNRFSARALDYSDLQDHEILYLYELGDMDRESTIKFVGADDKGYIIEVTEKDKETGRFKTFQRKIPPITTITTTTKLVLDREFRRRAWEFTTDNSKEQTEKVKLWRAILEKEKTLKALGRIKITAYEFSREVIRRFIQRFEPINVVIPFPKSIANELRSEALRTRGDIDKIYTFIKLYAMLNKERLIKAENGTYIVTPEVAIEALRILAKPLAEMHTKISRREIEVLKALKSLNEFRKVRVGFNGGAEVESRFDTPGTVIDKEIREKIAVKLRKSEKYIREILSSLESSGYVSSDNKKPKNYTLLYSVEEILEDLTAGLEAIGTSNSLIQSMVEEAERDFGIKLEQQVPGNHLVRSVHENIKLGSDCPFSENKQEERRSKSDNETIKVVRSLSALNTPDPKEYDARSINHSDIMSVEKSSSMRDKDRQQDKKELYCPYCKDLVFYTERDLREHIRARHRGERNKESTAVQGRESTPGS